MNNPVMDAPRTRPLGITIIAILVALSGLVTVVLSLIALFAVHTSGVATGLVVVALILGIVNLVLAYGLWTLKSWAFWATAALEAINLVLAIIAIATGSSASSQIGTLILSAIILIYLFADRNVRPAFRT